MVHQQLRPPRGSASPADELVYLRSQNEQLWRIVEKQRVTIHNLQKDNTRLAIERDGLVSKLQGDEKALAIRTTTAPGAGKKLHQHRPPSVAVDDMGSDHSLSPDSATSPVPPPRSPFRRATSDDMATRSPPVSPPGSTTNVAMELTAANRSRANLLEQDQRRDQRTMEMTDRQGFEHDGNTLALGDISVKVASSNLKTNKHGKEVISFTIAVGRQRPGDIAFHELWRVEKLYSDFLDLDTKLKVQSTSVVASKISRLPEKALFSTNAPSKVDQRKIALEHYLQQTLVLPWDDVTDLCEFLSTNVVKQRPAQRRHKAGHKEGYLTKRGKNFGGWKTRYFVMNGDMIDYFESREGNHLGTIRLTNAQIGRQQPSVTSNPATANGNDDSSYRHAFLLVEQKRAGSSTVSRHILCAESDQERDDWVNAILKNIHYDDDPNFDQQRKTKQPKKDKHHKTPKGDIQAESKEASSSSSSSLASPADVGIAVSNIQGLSPATTSAIDVNADSPTAATSLHHHPLLPNNAASDYSRCSLDHPLPTHPHNIQPATPQLPRRNSTVSSAGTGPDPLATSPRAPSPMLGGGRMSSDDLQDDPADKKKTKTNRMTFWGRKRDPPAPGNNALQVESAAAAASSSPPAGTRTSIAPTGFRHLLSRTSSEADRQNAGQQRGTGYSNAKQAPHSHLQPTPVTQGDMSGSNLVFGVPLEEAVRVSRAAEGYELPSVVYRCIEYLDEKDATSEEGLYRLSGSSKVMKALRLKFDQQGDIDLLASDEEYDVHAIAGLLKLWLRELPSNVLTRERYPDFLHVIDLLDHKDRVNELGRLVSELPLANYTLLRALIAHLLCVVQHSDINKMTARNVSIVFSPTLGIPAMVFSLLLSEFDYVFWTAEDGADSPPPAGPRTSIDAAAADYRSLASPLPPPPPSKMARKPTLKLREESGMTNRNSISYVDGAPAAMVDLERNKDGPFVLDDYEEDELTMASPLQSPEEDCVPRPQQG